MHDHGDSILIDLPFVLDTVLHKFDLNWQSVAPIHIPIGVVVNRLVGMGLKALLWGTSTLFMHIQSQWTVVNRGGGGGELYSVIVSATGPANVRSAQVVSFS